VTLDPEVVRGRCAEIEDALGRLERLAHLSRDEFLANSEAQELACYRLLIAIEAALALCYHVSARRLRRAPEDYAACFRVLSDAGLIDAALAARLQAMSRFRNLLVHMYWKLDYSRVYDIMHDHAEDLRQFAAAVAALV
jgi:uncharacterized protein YutE (UPF0331/DUF86 family)